MGSSGQFTRPGYSTRLRRRAAWALFSAASADVAASPARISIVSFSGPRRYSKTHAIAMLARAATAHEWLPRVRPCQDPYPESITPTDVAAITA